MLGETGAPPGAIVPSRSGGTSKSVTVAAPVVAYGGSRTRAYVPVVGRLRASTNPPLVPKNALPPTGLPSGPSSVAVADEYVELAILRLIRCPAVAANVSRPFCPGTLVVIRTGVPSVIGPP